MALPSGITPKSVTFGIASFFDGTVAAGRVTISAPVNVVHTPTNRPIFSSNMVKPFVNGEATFDLCPTDAAGLNRVDWTYTAAIEVSGARVQPEVIRFLLPEAGPDSVDLDGLVTVPSSAGTPISVQVLTAEQADPITAAFLTDPDSQTRQALTTAVGALLVVHGTDPAVARPATTGPVIWFGTVQPTNADNTLDVYLPVQPTA